jgi:ECF transporter S component (folate family)
MAEGGFFFMFDKEYWRSSASKLSSIHFIALMAAFIAMKIIVGNIYIPVAQNLRVGVNFVLVAVEASILGPAAGMVSAAITDLLGFALFPSGPFFAGYTLTAVCGSLIYALLFYRRRITVLRITIAKILNNYLVNVLLGSLWSAILYDKAFIVYAATSAIKNTVLLPFEIVLLVVVFNLLAPILVRRHLIEDPGKLPLHWK